VTAGKSRPIRPNLRARSSPGVASNRTRYPLPAPPPRFDPVHQQNAIGPTRPIGLALDRESAWPPSEPERRRTVGRHQREAPMVRVHWSHHHLTEGRAGWTRHRPGAGAVEVGSPTPGPRDSAARSLQGDWKPDLGIHNGVRGEPPCPAEYQPVVVARRWRPSIRMRNRGPVEEDRPGIEPRTHQAIEWSRLPAPGPYPARRSHGLG